MASHLKLTTDQFQAVIEEDPLRATGEVVKELSCLSLYCHLAFEANRIGEAKAKGKGEKER